MANIIKQQDVKAISYYFSTPMTCLQRLANLGVRNFKMLHFGTPKTLPTLSQIQNIDLPNITF